MSAMRKIKWLTWWVVVGLVLAGCLPTDNTGPVESRIPTVNSAVHWGKITRSGKLVIGISPDYPPFEYYDENYQVDGFDVAVMKRIGEILGLEVEFQNFAFDGLGNALVLGQIDAAISAISITPERQALVDFSLIYFMGQDAILALPSSNPTEFNSLAQLANYRVGVQAGSVFETILQQELVEKGLMPTANLFIYSKMDQAAGDLQDGFIDLIYLDLVPALNYAQTGKVVVAGRGVLPQYYAIAIPKGSEKLQEVINLALREMYKDGDISELAVTYLLSPVGVEMPQTPPTSEPPATPSPAPTVTAPTVTPPPCLDGMTYVKDLNLDDQNMTNIPQVAPGKPFTKGWRIKNSGTCTWNSSYYLAFSFGNVPEASMGGQPTPIRGVVAPGETYDIYVNLVAPQMPGIYQGFWNMVNGQNVAFGQRVYVAVQIPPQPTPTLRPTQTPSPGIQFTADQTVITKGEPVTFSWNVTGSKESYFYIQGQPYGKYPVPPQSTRVEYPAQSTVYELRVVFLNDQVDIRQIFIQVNPPPMQAPDIVRFSLNPPESVYQGQCVTIQWQVEGDVSKIALRRDQIVLWPEAPFQGSFNDCPVELGTFIYMIEATGGGGASQQSRSLTVVPQEPAPQPTATPGPVPPVVVYFNANPNEILISECTTLSWEAGGGADRIQLWKQGALALDNGPLVGNFADCLQSTGQVDYLLKAMNAMDQMTESRVIVNVIYPPEPPTNPLTDKPWKLAYAFDGVGAQIPPLPGTEILIFFNQDGTFVGEAGCNQYGGRYTQNENNLVIDPEIQATKLVCSEPVGAMEQERAYLTLLLTTTRFEGQGTELLLYNTTNQKILDYLLDK